MWDVFTLVMELFNAQQEVQAVVRVDEIVGNKVGNHQFQHIRSMIATDMTKIVSRYGKRNDRIEVNFGYLLRRKRN